MDHWKFSDCADTSCRPITSASDSGQITEASYARIRCYLTAGISCVQRTGCISTGCGSGCCGCCGCGGVRCAGRGDLTALPGATEGVGNPTVDVTLFSAASAGALGGTARLGIGEQAAKTSIGLRFRI